MTSASPGAASGSSTTKRSVPQRPTLSCSRIDSPDAPRGAHQHQVAHAVAQRRVDAREVVQVDQQHRQVAARCRRHAASSSRRARSMPLRLSSPVRPSMWTSQSRRAVTSASSRLMAASRRQKSMVRSQDGRSASSSGRHSRAPAAAGPRLIAGSGDGPGGPAAASRDGPRPARAHGPRPGRRRPGRARPAPGPRRRSAGRSGRRPGG